MCSFHCGGEYKPEDIKNKSKKYPLHYVKDECINCGRCRVEKYTDGSLICEKCHFNQETNQYDTDEMKFL